MKKIKLAMVINDLNINGISTVVMNYCEMLNSRAFDISVISGLPVDSSYYLRCEHAGIKIIELPPRKSSPKAYYKALWGALSEQYDIVHVHGNSATISIELLIAKLRGIKIRIAHCHNSTCNNKKAHKLLLPLFNSVYTHGFACSNLAGRWLFGDKKFYVIPNGFDTEKFRFLDIDRNETRDALGLVDKYVIGHIGRFNNQKNHPFLLEVFRRVAEQNSEAYLLLVGNGPEYYSIMQKIEEHPYKERIIVYGESLETEKLYAAMDVFAFPSKHEGLGIVLIEAQINGLPCIVSDVIPEDVVISDSIYFLPITVSDIAQWSDCIVNLCNRKQKRQDMYDCNIDKIKRFEIKEDVVYLESLYKGFFREKR